MPRKGTPTWRFQTFTNLGKTFFRISRTDLTLGEAFCIFIFFHFPDSGLSVLTGLHSVLFLTA